MDSHPGSCCVCSETPPSGNMTSADNSSVCHDCIRQIFQSALAHEFNYPPKWGNHTLDIRRYTQERILTQGFLGLYHQKEREYRCLPPNNRIFCSWQRHGTVQPCNTFLGARIRSTFDILANNGELVVRCRECHNLSCRACKTHIHSLTHATTHECVPMRAADPDGAAFQGLKRGRDFQLCPSEECEMRIELADGCNHVRYPCGMQFCFICGQPAPEGSGHWSRIDDAGPGCPRYNQPGAIVRYDNAPVRGLRASNPLAEHGIAHAQFDENIPLPHATEATRPANLFHQLREALIFPEHIPDFQVLEYLGAEAARREQHHDRRRRRLNTVSLDTAEPAPAQLTGPQRHAHPYHTAPIGQFAMNDQREQDAQDQRRLEVIQNAVQRNARRWHGTPTGASRGNPSTPQTPQTILNFHRQGVYAPDNVTAAIPRVLLQGNARQPQAAEAHARQPQAAEAHARHQDQSSRIPPIFPSAADVRPSRNWHSMLPMPTFTNAPVASLRSHSGLLPEPSTRSVPVYAPLPLRVVPRSGNHTDASRIQERADDMDAGSGREELEAFRRGSRFEEE
jgi:hypothetical protein